MQHDISGQMDRLREQHAAGQLSDAAYEAGYLQLSNVARDPCACGRATVTVRRASGAICAACALEGNV